MSSLKQLQAELAQHQDDLNVCHEMLALDPTSVDALETIPALQEQIADLTARIAEKQKDAPPPPPPPPPPSSEAKFDMSKHPKFRNVSPESGGAAPPAVEETQAVFNVKDTVMAKYSEDKQWYQATITSKTGSSHDPVYKVTFKGYGNSETKRKHEIRAVVENSKKRKADGSTSTTNATATATDSIPPPPPPQPTKTNNGTVISAEPYVDTTAVANKRREPSKVSDGPTRLAPEPKKLKGSKTLDKAKSSWQDFQKTGPKKSGAGGGAAKLMGRDSQFRTPDLPGAKVGFTGSGKPMKKDQARSTWKYGAATDEDD